MALRNLGDIAYYRGNYEQATTYYEECLVLSRELGEPWDIASAFHRLGRLAQVRGDTVRALEHHRKSLAQAQSLGTSHVRVEALEGSGCGGPCVTARQRERHGSWAQPWPCARCRVFPCGW